MIDDQFQSVINKTASEAPENFTRENISDLYKLKLGKAKQLCTQFSKMRAYQEIKAG
jgi:SUMO ligase MMS21 Smc5/6 complex component